MSRTVIDLPFAAEGQDVQARLTYAPMQWETHPIDLAYGSQGWGPFMGPWQTVDFINPAAAIDITYASGDNNEVRAYAPGYDVTTLFHDPSLDRVHNASLLATLAQAASGAGGRVRAASSTIANGGSGGDGNGASLGRLRSLLGVGE